MPSMTEEMPNSCVNCLAILSASMPDLQVSITNSSVPSMVIITHKSGKLGREPRVISTFPHVRDFIGCFQV